jgi:hypothetical protein
MKEHRGRPSETPAIALDKWVLDIKDWDTSKTIIKFNRSISPNGPYSIEITPPKGHHHPKFKLEKGKAYGKQPVVMVFKTSDRSNAQTKIKVWANENIDYILSSPKLVGVPSKHVMMDIGVGKSMVEKYKKKYNLN